MRNVVYAMLPICAWSVYQFGVSALALILVTTLSCILTESFFCWMSGRPNSVKGLQRGHHRHAAGPDTAAGFPLWMAAVAGFIAIALGKSLFGGLGFNVMNPALIGRAFVQAAFPWPSPPGHPSFTAGRF